MTDTTPRPRAVSAARTRSISRVLGSPPDASRGAVMPSKALGRRSRGKTDSRSIDGKRRQWCSTVGHGKHSKHGKHSRAQHALPPAGFEISTGVLSCKRP